MTPMPANLKTQYPACRLTGVIGMLLAYLVRLQASSETSVPPDIAYMVASVDLMVQDVICYLAERQLRDAGYLKQAEVLRTTGLQRPVCAPSATTSPKELIARIEATRTLFEQAEALSQHLARLVVCLYCFLNSDVRRPTCHIMAMADHAYRIPRDHHLSPEPWPPPTRIASIEPRAA